MQAKGLKYQTLKINTMIAQLAYRTSITAYRNSILQALFSQSQDRESESDPILSKPYRLDKWATKLYPTQNQSVLQVQIAREFLEKSAIAPDVFALNVRIVADLEFDPVTNEVIETPIADALGFRYTRFGKQTKETEHAALFPNEDGEVWQGKIYGIESLAWLNAHQSQGKRTGQYMAPKGIGDKPYLASYPKRIQEALAAQHGLEPPGEGESFWEWFLKHPEIPLTVTEGGKKALALISQGYVALSLYGCECGVKNGEVKPELLPYVQNREVTIAYDRDTKPETRHKVFKATKRLGNAITYHAKGTVKIATWDGSQGKGIDDLIANDPNLFTQAMNQAKPFEQWKNRKLTDLTPYISQVIHSRYIPQDLAIPETAKIIGLVSAKNTGKTEWIAKQVEQAQRNHQRCLAIVHRIQLAIALSNRFGIDHIDEIKDSETGGILGYALCIDSLRPNGKAKFNPYDWYESLIILDECEQVIWELLNSDRKSLKQNRPVILQTLKDVLQTATSTGGKVILSDADLSPITLDYIKALIGNNPELWLLVNTFIPNQDKRKLYNYASSEDWLSSIIDAVRKDKRLLIHTGAQKAESKYSTTNLYSLLSELFPDLAVLAIDAETVAEPKHSAFGCMANLSHTLANYQIVIASPVIETGISIDDDLFDAVYAYGSGVQTVQQFCQTLERYRLDVDRHIFTRKSSNQRIASGETEPDSLMATEHKKANEIIKGLSVADSLAALDDENPKHLAAWAKRASLINQDFKRYQDAILEKLAKEGYEILDPNPDVIYDSEGLGETITEIRDRNYDQETQAISDSPNPDDLTHKRLKDKQAKTKQERYQERKGDLCRALATDDLDQKTVQKCDQGWLSQLTLHFYMTTGKDFLVERDRRNLKKLGGESGQVCKKDVNRSTLLPIQTALNFLDIQQFLDPTKRFTKKSLKEWYEKKVLPNRVQLRQLLGITINPDKDTAISVVNRILAKFGLSLEYLGRFGERGKQERTYGGANQNPDDRQAIFARWFDRDAILYRLDTVSTKSLQIDKTNSVDTAA
ncbi:MAG: plasmid replication protein, CyRepA1 family [Cyanobium sp.]